MLTAAAMDNHPRARSLRRMYSHNDGQQGQGQHGTRSINNSNGGGSSSSSSNAGQQQDQWTPAQAGIHAALQMKHKRPGQSLADAAAQAEWANKKWVWVPDPTLGYVAGWIVKEGEAQKEDAGPSPNMATVSCLDDKVCVSVCKGGQASATLICLHLPVAFSMVPFPIRTDSHRTLRGPLQDEPSKGAALSPFLGCVLSVV